MYYLCMMKTKINPWVYDKWYDTKQREHNLHVNKEVLLLNHVCIKDGIDDVLLLRYATVNELELKLKNINDEFIRYTINTLVHKVMYIALVSSLLNAHGWMDGRRMDG